jgi:hypothetical protein
MADVASIPNDFNVDDFLAQEDESEDSEGESLEDEVSAEAAEYAGDEEEEEEEEEDEEDEDDEELPKPKKAEVEPSSRANKRIRKLISQNKELSAAQETARKEYETQIQQFQEQQAQYAQWGQQLQQQMHEQQVQHAAVQKELELARQQRELQDEENLDPVERLKRDAIREAVAASDAKWSEQFKQVQKRQEELEQEAAQRRDQRQRRERLDSLKYANQQAVANLVEGIPAERSDVLTPKLQAQIINFAAVNGITDMHKAAKLWEKDAFDYVFAKIKTKQSKSKQKLDRSQRTPSKSPKGKRSAGGKKRKLPSYAELTQRGMDSYLDLPEFGGDG